MVSGVVGEPILPLGLRMLTARKGLTKMGERLGWDMEERLNGPTQVLLRQLDLFHTQR